MKKFIIICLSTIVFLISIILAIDIIVIGSSKNKIYTLSKLKDLKDIDAILVLGAGLKNNRPSLMLEERLDEAIKLYNNNISKKIIVSGDHGRENYDEVNIMKKYLIDKGIPSDDIFMDHAGFNTYNSMYRAKHIFNVNKMVIVTQEYHLYRSIYVANSLGIESYGSNATKVIYGGQGFREIREFLARIKDFFLSITKPSSDILGDKIDLNLSGNITNDYYIRITDINHNEVYYKKDEEFYNQVLDLTNKKRVKKCNNKITHKLVLNGHTVYEMEILDDTIHIVDKDEEIILTKDESKIILDFIKR